MDENLDDIIASLLDSDDESAPSSSADGKPRLDETENALPTDVTVHLTERASREVLRIKQAESLPDSLRLRVAVEGGGCSGLSYKLGFDEPGAEDLQCESQSVEIVVDPSHALYLEGIVIDYPDGLEARGFVFSNPNASESCGCGSSFAV
jgi:iron-sulfur cluster assembly protein